MTAPLFLLAPPRSFTTVVTAMMGNHPQMFGLAETNIFARPTIGDLLMMHRRVPRFGHGLLRSVAELGFGAQTDENIATVRDWLGENSDLTGADVFAGLQDWAEGRGLIEKSPMHIMSIDSLRRIEAACPGARYLHMTRHPLAVYTSTQELRDMVRKGPMGNVVKHEPSISEVWLDPHMTIMEFLDDIPEERQIRVRGEDLMSDPAANLALLCEWLDIDTGAEAVDAMLHPENSPFAKMGPSSAPFGNDPKFMQNPALRPYTPRDPAMSDISEAEHGVVLDADLIECAAFYGYD